MSKEVFEEELMRVYNYVTKCGLDRTTYEKIAQMFMGYMPEHSKIIDELLKAYINVKETPIYINEIRNYLKDNNKSMYKEYAKCFLTSAGCYEVFGLQPINVKEYKFEESEQSEEDKKPKEIIKNRNKKQIKTQIKSMAKSKAIANQKQAEELKKEKTKKKELIYEKIRKQDL